MNEAESSSSLGKIPCHIYILCEQTFFLSCNPNASLFRSREHESFAIYAL